MFTGEDLDDDTNFEPEDIEGDDNDKGGDDKGSEETGSPFPASAKTTGER